MFKEICSSHKKSFIEYLLSKVLKEKIRIDHIYGTYLVYNIDKNIYMGNYNIHKIDNKYHLYKWEV